MGMHEFINYSHHEQVIRDSQSDKKMEPVEKLIVKAQVARTLDRDPVQFENELPATPDALVRDTDLGDANGFIKICVRVFVSFVGDSAASDVTITTNAPSFVDVYPANVVLNKISGFISLFVCVFIE